MLIRPDDDAAAAGFTLLEVLVAVILLGVVGGFVLTSVVRALQITSETSERTDALTDIERGLERVSRQIRTADPLLIDPDNDCDTLTTTECVDTVLTRRLDADTYIDGERRQYSYYLQPTADAVELRQDLEVFDASTGTLQQSSDGEFIADIANLEPGGEPLFEFRAIDGVTGEMVPIDCSGLSVSECRTEYGKASVVEITLQKLLRTNDVVTASTSVAIRSTRYAP